MITNKTVFLKIKIITKISVKLDINIIIAREVNEGVFKWLDIIKSRYIGFNIRSSIISLTKKSEF